MKSKHTGITIILVALTATTGFIGLKLIKRPSDFPHTIATHVITEPNAQSVQAMRDSGNLAHQADEMVAKGRDAEAEALLRRSVDIYPHNDRAAVALAELYERQGRIKETVEAYRRLVDNPQGGSIEHDPVTAMHYVLALLQEGQSTRAVTVYQQAMVRSALPSIPDEIRHLAGAGRDNGRLDGYVRHYAWLEERFDADNPDVRGLEAAAHYLLGTHGPGYKTVSYPYMESHLKRAVQLRPRWARAQEAYAEHLRNVGRFKEAAVAEARALELGDPHAISRHQQLVAAEKARKAPSVDKDWRKHGALLPGQGVPPAILTFRAQVRQWQIANKNKQ